MGADLAEQIAQLTPAQREVFIKRLPPAAADRAKQIISEWATKNAQEGNAVQLLPHQRLPKPSEIKKGALLSGGRGIGKTLTLANYISRAAESVPKLRMRVIAPTLSDAVNAVVLDPESGIMAHSPTATFKSSGVEGARVTWPNGSVCFLVGTPTLKDVDRLRALTNIDLDAFEEAAANPRLTEATKQAALSRRGKRLHHPIFIAASTPRPVPIYKEWLADPAMVVTHASMADNPHTPESYREYGESLKGTHLYDQEVLGHLVEDIPGALWKQTNIDASVVRDPQAAQDILDMITKIVVGVDPPSGHGTCGIVVAGLTDPQMDPTGRSRIVILDDFSIADASPHQWGTRVIEAAKTYGAHIVAEQNQGGLMVESTIMQAATDADQEFTTVTLANAVVSKERRASPVALLWEMTPQRALIVPPKGDLTGLAKLIDQMISWIPKTFSPDRLDACLVEGTPVLTPAGEVPIESVCPGDQVWTRAGWRPVEAARMTQEDAELVTVNLTNGRQLTGTRDHRVLTDRGWVELDSLVWADTLSAWNESSTTGSSTQGIRTAIGSRSAATSQRHEGAAYPICIDRSISTTMDRSLQGSMCTTLTEIRATTPPTISRPCLPANMPRFMVGMGSSPQSGSLIFGPSDPLRRSGMPQRRGEGGTQSTAGLPGRTESESIASSATSVANRPRASSPTMEASTDSAPGFASIASTTELADTTSLQTALYAALSFPSAEGDPQPVGSVRVSGKLDAGRGKVYDLQVAGQHEFLASGVIVHNCVWAATYLMMGGAAPAARLQRNPPRQITKGQAFRNALMGRR